MAWSSEGHSDLYSNDNKIAAREHENKLCSSSPVSHAQEEEVTNSDAGIGNYNKNRGRETARGSGEKISFSIHFFSDFDVAL